jgi:hypothetical protein
MGPTVGTRRVGTISKRHAAMALACGTQWVDQGSGCAVVKKRTIQMRRGVVMGVSILNS